MISFKWLKNELKVFLVSFILQHRQGLHHQPWMQVQLIVNRKNNPANHRENKAFDPGSTDRSNNGTSYLQPRTV